VTIILQLKYIYSTKENFTNIFDANPANTCSHQFKGLQTSHLPCEHTLPLKKIILNNEKDTKLSLSVDEFNIISVCMLLVLHILYFCNLFHISQFD
jgi:hypothetical protein